MSTTKAWQVEVRKHMAEYPQKDFIESIRFLVRLGNEAKLPVQ